MPEPREKRADEKAVMAAIEEARKDPLYSPLFNLTEVTAGNRKVVPNILKRMVMENTSITFFSESGMGKTTMINLLSQTYQAVCSMTGKDPAISINLWDDAKDEALRRAGPANTWENYELPNQIQLAQINNSETIVQANEVVAKGYGAGLWDAGSSVLEDLAKRRGNMVFINIPQEDGMQLLTDKIRGMVRIADPKNNIIDVLSEKGITVRGALPNEQSDRAIREWARKSGLRKHMDLKRREEKEIIDEHLDKVTYRSDLKHHDKIVSPPPSEYLSVRVTPNYDKFLAFLGITDPEVVDTMTGELRLNAAMGLTTLRQLRVKGSNGYVVFNIPELDNHGGLTIPSPVSI